MRSTIDIQLAQYKRIKDYRPRIGDFIIWHGWLTHYYGVVGGVDENNITMIKAGLPVLLFGMSPDDFQKNTTKVPLNRIRGSRPGTFAALQGLVWYV